MKAIVILAALFAFCEAQLSMNNPQYCYSLDPIRPQNGRHTTWSAYESIRRIHVDPTVSTCTPARFWYAGRHGGDLPDAAKIQRILDLQGTHLIQNITDNYNLGKTTLCVEDFELIQTWRLDPNITTDNAEFLTVQGWMAMEDLARRWQSRYPTLLPTPYTQANYFFRSSNAQSTIGSLRAVADGLFGAGAWNTVVMAPIPPEDRLLRPNDFCPEFNALANNREEEAFRMGPEYRRMITNVNYKLGFFEGEQLPWTTIETMWDVCRFEKSENLTIPSEVCTAFSIHDNEVLEFLSDCDYYYRNGYGTGNTRLVTNMACGLVQDLLQTLSTTQTTQLARFFITHSTVMQLLATSFDFFDDELYDWDTLTRHNVAQTMTRLWRTSWISPKGANFVAVRYDCAGGDNDVVFWWNERPIQLPGVPGCQMNGLCKVNQVVAYHNRFLNANCDNLFCSSQ